MDVSAALTTQLHAITGHVGIDDHQTADAVTALTHDLTQAVGSYLGLQLVLVDQGHPVTLTSFDPTVRPDLIATSLRLALYVLDVPGADPDSTITFYAQHRGAFTDLAADLSYALTRSVSAAGQDLSTWRDTHDAIKLDDPVLPTTVQSGLLGTADLSTINRAIGMLIGDGHHPDDARGELGRLADGAGATTLAYATQLVRPSHRQEASP